MRRFQTSLRALNEGTVGSRNLSEILKVDFTILAQATFPSLPKSVLAEIESAKSLGILRRMEKTASLLKQWDEKAALGIASSHGSDTVRGWGAFIVGSSNKPLKSKLDAIKPYADDEHFGVREWSWMAVRSDISSGLTEAIQLFSQWTSDKSYRVRRFACESTRPRGVWASHIVELKENPEHGLPILTSLRADPERYVQDSVANWLNDAAKSNPNWVKKLCAEWKKTQTVETEYIIKKALRSLK